jgi:hypothetical protein
MIRPSNSAAGCRACTRTSCTRTASLYGQTTRKSSLPVDSKGMVARIASSSESSMVSTASAKMSAAANVTASERGTRGSTMCGWTLDHDVALDHAIKYEKSFIRDGVTPMYKARQRTFSFEAAFAFCGKLSLSTAKDPREDSLAAWTKPNSHVFTSDGRKTPVAVHLCRRSSGVINYRHSSCARLMHWSKCMYALSMIPDQMGLGTICPRACCAEKEKVLCTCA